MKFHLNHDPANKTLTIPRAALQLSGLAETTAPKMTLAMAAIGKKSVFRMSCRCVCWQRPASTRRKAISNVR